MLCPLENGPAGLNSRQSRFRLSDQWDSKAFCLVSYEKRCLPNEAHEVIIFDFFCQVAVSAGSVLRLRSSRRKKQRGPREAGLFAVSCDFLPSADDRDISCCRHPDIDARTLPFAIVVEIQEHSPCLLMPIPSQFAGYGQVRWHAEGSHAQVFCTAIPRSVGVAVEKPLMSSETFNCSFASLISASKLLFATRPSIFRERRERSWIFAAASALTFK